MKRKLSKILGIALTVALLTSLLISAAPALALTQATVTIATGQNEISKADAEYTVRFTVDKQLSGNGTVQDSITITMPAGTVVDNTTIGTTLIASITAGPGWVEAGPSPLAYNTTSANALAANWSADKTARTITFGMPNTGQYIGEGAQVLIKITKGITNPADPGSYALTVKTSQETTAVTSATYTLITPVLTALPGVATAYNSAGIAMGQSNTIMTVAALAGEGGKVVLSAGTYNENVALNVKGVTLEGQADVFIASTGSVTVNAADVIVKNITVKSSATAASRITIAAGGDNAIVQNCVIEASGANDQIVIAAGATGVKISNNTIAAGTKNGVAIAGTANAEVSGNTMTVTTAGTAIAAADNATIKTNTITGSSGTGISITGGIATIEENTLKTLDTAINYSVAVTANKNMIDGCGNTAGAFVVNSSSAANSTFTNNTVQNSNAASYAFNNAGAGCINANFNNILNNTKNIKATAGVSNFKLNWWGSDAGPAAGSNSATAPGTIDVTSPLGAAPGTGNSAAVFNAATVSAQTTAGVDISAVTTAGVASAMTEAGVSKLNANPVIATPPIMGTGSVIGYWDIYVKPGNANDVLTIKIFSASVSEYTKVYYGGGLSGLWSIVSNQGVNVAGGYAWFTTSGTTTPSTSDLTGTPFALVTDKTLAAPAITAAAGATPAIGSYDISVTPTFTWGAVAGADHYQINLCEDPSFTILEWAYNVDTPFFKADEALRNETTYYWRVRGVLDAASTAFTPWATGIFTTEAEAVAAETPITVDPVVPEVTVEIPPTKITVEPSAPAIPTYLLWIIVVVGAVLVIALIVLIVRTRRVA